MTTDDTMLLTTAIFYEIRQYSTCVLLHRSWHCCDIEIQQLLYINKSELLVVTARSLWRISDNTNIIICGYRRWNRTNAMA